MKLSEQKHQSTLDTSENSHNIYEFLKSKSTGILATTDPNGYPHATVVYIAVNEDFSILFTTKRQTKKYDNIKHNNHAMMVVYDPSSQTTAQITGIIEEVKDVQQTQKAFDQMLAASMAEAESGIPPLTKLYAGGYVGLRLKPVEIRMAMFLRPDPGGYDIYETLEFPL